MANLAVKEPVANDLLDLRQDFERVFQYIFNQHLRPAASTETFFKIAPPIETWVDTEDKEFHLTMPLPGVKPEALNISLQGNNLTLSGEQEQEEDKSTKEYLEREFSYGSFLRTVTLPDGVDGDKMTAQLKDGILEITAPIAATALPKKIAVKNGGTPTKEGEK